MKKTFKDQPESNPLAKKWGERVSHARRHWEGARPDPGDTRAAFRLEALAGPFRHAWQAAVEKSEKWLSPLGDKLKDRYAHTPDNQTDYLESLGKNDWDRPQTAWIKDLGIASQVARYKTAETAARLAADMASPMGSPDTLMLQAAGDYRFAPKEQSGIAWAHERTADFLPQLVRKGAGVLKSERRKLENSHSDDYRQRSLFDPDNNILTSPSAVAGRLMEDVLPGVGTVAGLTKALGGGSASYLAQLGAPYLAEGVATYYEERDKFHDRVMAASEDDLVHEYPEYAALLGRYPDRIEAKKELIRQKAAPYAYEQAAKSLLMSMGMNRFIKSTRTRGESDVLQAFQRGSVTAVRSLMEQEQEENKK